MKSAGNYALCNHHPGINGIDANFARPELLRQRSCDCVDCPFRGVVNNRSRWSQGTGERTDINDATAFGGEMLECLLGGEKHSENVCIKHFVELLLGDVFEWHEFVNAGVINHDIDLAECFLRFSEQSLDVCLLGDVALDSDSFSAA